MVRKLSALRKVRWMARKTLVKTTRQTEQMVESRLYNGTNVPEPERNWSGLTVGRLLNLDPTVMIGLPGLSILAAPLNNSHGQS
jgi:hypothetical protein